MTVVQKKWQDYINAYDEGSIVVKNHINSVLNDSNMTTVEKEKATKDWMLQCIYSDWLHKKNIEIQEFEQAPVNLHFDDVNGSCGYWKDDDNNIHAGFIYLYSDISNEDLGATEINLPICNLDGILLNLYITSATTNIDITRRSDSELEYENMCWCITNTSFDGNISWSLGGAAANYNAYQTDSWCCYYKWNAQDIPQHINFNNISKSGNKSNPIWDMEFITGNNFIFNISGFDVNLMAPWEAYNNNILLNLDAENAIFPNGYGKIISPFSLKPWSIKETKDDIKIANTFPYDGHDAGNGIFFSLIRPKIKYDSLERDSNSNIVIKGLKFNFEDAVRKVCQREGSDTPEKFLLATYSLEDINSQDSFISLGEMKKGDTSIETPALITLKNNSTIGAFYKGQLVSNYNISNPNYKILVIVNWKGKPESESWQGTAIIDVVNALTDEIIQTQIIDQPINNTYSFYLPSSTDDGEEIPYKINYKINDENNDWTVDPIQSNIIYYKDKKHSINIVNRWNKIIYDNTDTIIINVEKFDTDFKTKQVSEFFAYLKTKNAILDWEQEIKNNNNYKRMKENTAKIFCAQYKWSEHNGTNIEECFILIPFLSIAIKDIYGVVNIYTFHLRSPYVIDSDTPLKKDMYNGDLSIIWPYISQREYKYVDNNESKEWQLGAESTKLFGRKGCYEESDGQISLYYNWTNDKDVYYKEPPTGKTSNFYIGEPHISLPNEKYTTVNNSILYSKIDLSEDSNRNVLLSNFCIYCIDENCISDTSVEAAIPYYYKATILLPYGRRNDNLANGAGVIVANVFFNNKNNYWNIDAPDIAAPVEPPYKVHKWQSYGTNNYVDYQGDFIITNIEKIQDAAADVIGESFFNESKAILD